MADMDLLPASSASNHAFTILQWMLISIGMTKLQENIEVLVSSEVECPQHKILCPEIDSVER